MAEWSVVGLAIRQSRVRFPLWSLALAGVVLCCSEFKSRAIFVKTGFARTLKVRKSLKIAVDAGKSLNFSANFIQPRFSST